MYGCIVAPAPASAPATAANGEYVCALEAFVKTKTLKKVEGKTEEKEMQIIQARSFIGNHHSPSLITPVSQRYTIDMPELCTRAGCDAKRIHSFMFFISEWRSTLKKFAW